MRESRNERVPVALPAEQPDVGGGPGAATA
jgi:hypothetical protein